MAKRHLLTVTAGSAVLLASVYFEYVSLILGRSGELLARYRNVIEREAYAPEQYRFLVPDLAGAAGHLGLSLPQAAVLIDGGSAIVAAIALYRLALLLRLPIHVYIGACLAAGWWALSLALYPRPEPFAALGALCLLALGLVEPGRGARLAFVAIGALVLIGTRTDVLAAVGIGLVASGVLYRKAALTAVGAALTAVAGAATIALTRAFPHVHYPPGTSVVQLRANLAPTYLLGTVVIFTPLLIALIVIWRGRRWTSALTVAVVALGAHVGISCVVARIHEARIWFPFTAPVALLVIGALYGASSEADSCPAKAAAIS